MTTLLGFLIQRRVEGPALDKSLLGFVGYFPMPVRHGMTVGELARLFNAENKIGAALTVVELKHWSRDDWFDDTGRGECRVPQSWKLLYKAGNDWKPVEEVSAYGVKLNALGAGRWDGRFFCHKKGWGKCPSL